MTGTEKQIEYANTLKGLFVKAYQAEIDENNDVPDYVAKLQSEMDFVNAYDGDAGKFINRFKRMGNDPDYFAARSALRNFQMDEKLRNLK